MTYEEFLESSFEVSDINRYFVYGVGEVVGPYEHRDGVRARIYLGMYYIEIGALDPDSPSLRYWVLIGNTEQGFSSVEQAEHHLWTNFVRDEVG